MNILLDPYIFVIPIEDARISDYLENLFVWLTAVTRDDNRFWLSTDLVDALRATSTYPDWDKLQDLEQRCQNVIYNANTLLRACESQLMEPPLLDELYINTVYYFEDDAVAIVPLKIEKRLPELVSKALNKTLAFAAIGSFFEIHEVYKNLVFATVSDELPSTQLDVTLNVHDLEEDVNRPILLSLDMLFSPNDIDDIVGMLDFWQDTQRAIAYIHRKIYSSHQNPPALPNVRIHPTFNQSIIDHNIEKRSAELHKVFRVVVMGLVGDVKRNQKEHHCLHRNGVPVKHGDSTAWRLWVEHSTPGWRVHYWLHADGTVELSNLVPHDTLYIPDPVRRSEEST